MRANIKCLLVGLGSAGYRHFQNLRRSGVRDFVFYSTGRGALRPVIRGPHPVERSLRAALRHRPDIAVIANPTSLHMRSALACAKQGCHLLIEKPLSDRLDGIERLRRLVRRKRLTVLVGCQFRFHPLLRSLKSGLGRGRLGSVVGASAEWGEHVATWHPWEDHRKSYSSRTSLGGGAILTLCHPVDYLYWLFGPVRGVKAFSRKVSRLRTLVNDDYSEILLDFASGVLARVHLDYLQRPAVHRLTVFGDSGRVTWDALTGTLVWENSRGVKSVERVPRGFKRNDLFLAEARHFLQLVLRGGRPVTPLSDGAAVLKVLIDAKKN